MRFGAPFPMIRRRRHFRLGALAPPVPSFDPATLAGLHARWRPAQGFVDLAGTQPASAGQVVGFIEDEVGPVDMTAAASGARPALQVVAGHTVAVHDGVDDAIETAEEALGIRSADWSMSALIRISSGSPLWRVNNTSVDVLRVVDNGNGSLEIYTRNKSSFPVTGKSSGDWLLLGLSKSHATGSLDIYVDGSLVLSDTHTPNSLGGLRDLRVGSRPGGVDPWAGSWAELLVYDRVLPSSEHATLYQGMRQNYGGLLP